LKNSGGIVMKNFNVVGKGHVKKDAKNKVLGKAIFAADIKLPNMLVSGVKRSKVASAKVLNIDTEKAKKVKGVKAVLTYKDIPGENLIGVINKDEPILVEDKIRRIGDPLALVAAETKEALEEALDLIEVELEAIPGIFTIEDALKDNSPKIHGDTNVLSKRLLQRGDVDEAFKKCDVITENEYTTPAVNHMFIEPEASVSQYEDGILSIWSTTQNAHYIRDEVGRMLNMNYSKIKSMQATTGGGFGGKLDVGTQCHTSLLSYYTKRPVKMVRDRKESVIVSSKRHPHFMKYKTGATKDGKILAMEVELSQDTGAYASYGLAVITRACVHAMGPYEVPNVRVKATMVYTNNPMSGAMRGFGVPQVSIGHEGEMDAIAEKLGIDPIEIRLKNCLVPGSVTGTGQKMENSVGIKETIDKAKEKAKEVIG
jgi:CO/xanthine dehydrogenase Mo-binding subunit